MSEERLALYTTIYPEALPFVADWYRTVLEQTDRHFNLWVGLDGLTPAEASKAIGVEPRANWVEVPAGKTPAQVRERALESLLDDCSAVVLVDSDDMLLPTRVEAARAGLRKYDVEACALRLVDVAGQEMGVVFGPACGEGAAALLPRCNVFGMSNTAYRSPLLRACLPLPDDCVLIDWLLATRAWALGASLHFDHTPQMAYRQHCRNIATTLPPLMPEDLRRATERVLNHYRIALSPEWPLPSPYQQLVRAAQERAEAFNASITRSTDTLLRYTRALDRLPAKRVWWWYVAHPDLEAIWRS